MESCSGQGVSPSAPLPPTSGLATARGAEGQKARWKVAKGFLRLLPALGPPQPGLALETGGA